MRPRAARMHHALRDALVIKMRNLLAQDVVFQQYRPAHSCLKRVLVVRNLQAYVGSDGLGRVDSFERSQSFQLIRRGAGCCSRGDLFTRGGFRIGCG